MANLFKKRIAGLYIGTDGVEAVRAEKAGARWKIKGFGKAGGDIKDCAPLAIQEAGIKKGGISASIPDTSAHVVILDFDEIPKKQSEAIELVRFKAGRFLNLSLSDRPIGFHVISREEGVKVLAVIPKGEIISDLHETAAANGLALDRISLHSLNLINLYFKVMEPGDGDFATICLIDGYFTAVFFKGNRLDFYRCKKAAHKSEDMWRDITATFLAYRSRRPQAATGKVIVFDAGGDAVDMAGKAIGDLEIITVDAGKFVEPLEGGNALRIMAALGAANA